MPLSKNWDVPFRSRWRELSKTWLLVKKKRKILWHRFSKPIKNSSLLPPLEFSLPFQTCWLITAHFWQPPRPAPLKTGEAGVLRQEHLQHHGQCHSGLGGDQLVHTGLRVEEGQGFQSHGPTHQPAGGRAWNRFQASWHLIQCLSHCSWRWVNGLELLCAPGNHHGTCTRGFRRCH